MVCRIRVATKKLLKLLTWRTQMSIRLFDIDIVIHWTFWALLGIFLIPEVLGMSLVGMAYAVWIFAWILFLVTAHELGHSLMAREYGYFTKVIYLHLLGGAAVMQSGHTPRETFWISLAGPMVNFVLLLPLAPLVLLSPEWFVVPALISLMLGVFNMIPAFPMDGGRIMRALLQLNGVSRSKAVSITQNIAIVLAAAFVTSGALTFNPFIFLIGFVILGAIWLERKGATL
jgi:Zn-dependent protease